MKQALIIGALSLLALGTIKSLYDKNRELTETLERTTSNLSQLEADNYSLSFEKDELVNYVKDLNTKFKQEIDSVTKANDIKLKDLQRLTKTHTVVTVRDTVFMEPEHIAQEDSLYELSYSSSHDCYDIKLTAMSADPETTLRVDELTTKNDSYYMLHYSKKKWWQLFKKRKLLMTTVDNCGTSTTTEVQVN